MQVMKEYMTIFLKMHNVLSKKIRERLPLLRGIEKLRLLEATRKVDEVMNMIEAGNIKELNVLYICWCCSGHSNVSSQE